MFCKHGLDVFFDQDYYDPRVLAFILLIVLFLWNFSELTEKVRLKKKKKGKPAQPKELFPGKKSSDMKEVTRSPLATRTLDMNSPLQIIQRKQVKDIDKKMTCVQENAMSRFVVREKENMWILGYHSLKEYIYKGSGSNVLCLLTFVCWRDLDLGAAVSVKIRELTNFL